MSDERTSGDAARADRAAPSSRRERRELRDRGAAEHEVPAKPTPRPKPTSTSNPKPRKPHTKSMPSAKKPAAPKKPATPRKPAASKKRPPAKKAPNPPKSDAPAPTPATPPQPPSPHAKPAAQAATSGKPRFSAAAYASAAAATIAEAAARAKKQRPSTELATIPNAITAGGTPSTRRQGGAMVSNKPTLGPPPSPREPRPPRTGPTDIARTTTGSIAKQRLTPSGAPGATGAIDTITRENLNPSTAARLEALTGPIELPSERRKRLRRRFGTIMLSSVLALVVVAAALGGWGWWTITRSFPQVTGTIALAGLNNTATVQRDSAGIPTITAESPTDLFFAQGYVHAQDRFWEMDVRRHITSGRLAELFGKDQVGTDKFLRALGWHDIAQQEYDLMTPRDQSYYDSYAAGVNAYLEAHTGAKASVEYALLGIRGTDYEPEPWTPVDSIAWMKAMAWDLRTNIEEETTRALLAQEVPLETIAELYPDYPFSQNPVIVAASSPIPPSGFVIGATAEPELGEADAPTSTTPADPSAPAQPAEGDAAASAVSVVAQVDRLLSAYGEGIGSNSWVVSGRLTESGKPLLANDPHLGAALPSVWTQLHLRCADVSEQCPFDVSGFSFSGLPGIIIGHNQRVAWGFTNLTTDVADLYIEWLDETGKVEYAGAMHDVSERTETIQVAGGSPVTFTVRSTTHGPIISDFTPEYAKIAEKPFLSVGMASDIASTDIELPPYQTITAGESQTPGEWAVSLRWTALDAGTSPQSIFALNTAQNFDDFRAAAKLFDVPAQNLIYADVDGNIGYQAPGKLPIRGLTDGWMPAPGWDPAYDWQGFFDFDVLPVVYNPASGYIVTANNAVIDGPASTALTRDWDYGFRAARIVQLVEQAIAAGKVTPESMATVQNDNRMWIGPRLANAFKNLTVPSDLQPIIADLQAWDGQNDADSAEAAYANVLWNRLALNIFAEREVPLPVGDQGRLFLLVDGMLQNPASPYWQNDALGVSSMREMLVKSAEQARDELVRLQGEDRTKWNWGDLHALELKNDTLGTSGIAAVEWLLNRGPFPTGGGGSIVNATGWTIGEGFGTVTVPSMRMVIDLDNFDNSTWINLTGQSGHTFHANYTDQTADWAAGVQRPWAYSPEAIAAQTAATLTLEPK